eukprot:358368-Chlamydomonas_euryale.AAC.6
MGDAHGGVGPMRDRGGSCASMGWKRCVGGRGVDAWVTCMVGWDPCVTAAGRAPRWAGKGWGRPGWQGCGCVDGVRCGAGARGGIPACGSLHDITTTLVCGRRENGGGEKENADKIGREGGIRRAPNPLTSRHKILHHNRVTLSPHPPAGRHRADADDTAACHVCQRGGRTRLRRLEARYGRGPRRGASAAGAAGARGPARRRRAVIQSHTAARAGAAAQRAH